jgi:hypothetical protein
MDHVEERRAVASGVSYPKEGWIDSGVGSETHRSFGQIESLATNPEGFELPASWFVASRSVEIGIFAIVCI